MTLTRLKTSWRAIVYSSGKVVATRAGFERRSDAKEWHDEQAKLWRTGRGVDRSATFADLADKYDLWHLSSVRPGTRERYGVEVKRLRQRLGFYRLVDLQPSILEGLKMELASELSPKAANYCLHVLRAMLNKGVKWRMLTDSPYSLSSLDEPEGAYAWWDDTDDIARFLAVAKERSKYYPLYLLALETGMREGEILGLWKDDVDLVLGRIHVCRQWLPREAAFAPPKHKRARYVDFDTTDDLARELRRAIATSSHETLVFPSTNGRPLSRSVVAEKVYKSLQRRAKVPPISFHSLRHTFASHYMLAHDDVWSLMALLGHADVKTTQRYAHHSQRARRKPLGLSARIRHDAYKSKVAGGGSA